MTTIRKIGNDNELDRILNRDFVSPIRSGYVEIGKDNICMPVYYENYHEQIRKFEVHDDDVFVTGHPRSGTTLTEEMVWLIVNNLDYSRASKERILKRSSLIEHFAFLDYELRNKLFNKVKVWESPNIITDHLNNPFKHIDNRERPRCLKSHLHWSLLPEQIQNGTKKPKIITVLRNAADVCVSYYYLSQAVESYKGTFEDYCELFLAGRVSYGPFWKQVLSYWEQRHRPNILFITYKEMKENLPGVIKKVSEFLEKSLTEEQIEKLAQHLSFEVMKKNPAINLEGYTDAMEKVGLPTVKNDFIRSGKVGDYKAKMSPELIKRFEAWSKENLAGTGLSLE